MASPRSRLTGILQSRHFTFSASLQPRAAPAPAPASATMSSSSSSSSSAAAAAPLALAQRVAAMETFLGVAPRVVLEDGE